MMYKSIGIMICAFLGMFPLALGRNRMPIKEFIDVMFFVLLGVILCAPLLSVFWNKKIIVENDLIRYQDGLMKQKIHISQIQLCIISKVYATEEMRIHLLGSARQIEILEIDYGYESYYKFKKYLSDMNVEMEQV